ncbi:MAG TPA: PH domain-containing protein [Bryobacteraceae bacterium]|jgi:uncharacterized membrane protein YdbT with pleckstrin-like domain
MSDLVIRPSTKIIIFWDIVSTLVIIGGAIAAYMLIPKHQYWYLGAIPGAIMFIGTAFRYIGVLMNKLTITTDHLRSESGFVSKSTHTIDLAKVQDVRVDQSVRQRVLGMGRISVETSGGASAIAIDDVDNPHKLADMILERSRQSPHHL